MANIKPLPKELQQVAIEELGEVPARIPEDLEALRSWIRQQPHLKVRTEDRFLVQFLRGCKYSLEKAKKKIDCYYTMLSPNTLLAPSYNVDDPKFRALLSTQFFLPLPTPLNGHGPRILFAQAINDLNDFTGKEIYKYVANLLEVLHLTDPYTCIQGFILLIDCAKVTSRHLALFTLTDLKTILTACDSVMPFRIKGIIFSQVPAVVENFLNILTPLFPAKIKSNVHVCGSNIDKLAQIVPRKYFPRDYGGENGLLDDVSREYNKLFDEYREHFKQWEEYGADERLRLGQPTDVTGELGIGGSFRKLNVD